MSTTIDTVSPDVAPVTQHEVKAKINWKMPITYFIASVLTLYLMISADGDATISFNRSKADSVKLSNWVVDARLVCAIAFVVCLLVCIYSVFRAVTRRKTGAAPAVLVGLFAVFALLVWFGGGSAGTITLTATLASALALSTPLIFGSLSGVVAERSGIVNMSIEGELLVGAFAGILVASWTGYVWLGLLAAPLAGMLLGAILAVFAVKYNVDQIIVGVVLNVLALGLTTFFYSTIMTKNMDLNRPEGLSDFKIPLLGDIPIIGPVLFRQTVLTYFMYVVIIVLTIMLFRSRWGLRMRACGEHPHAADTVGINVQRTRIRNTLFSAALAGLGGSYFTIGAAIAHSFNENISAGNGYIALAAMILGKWHPLGAVGASLMFGFANAISILLPSLQDSAPSNIINMIPYLVTVLAVAGFVGRSRPPASENVPYYK
ncbi:MULTISPECIES: ABC transporter permease [unclassified Actinobaculum]|uniref:ABC transporter permease n=1 Tax=unclassified Actinobaculum TaxID=2609299 RepID=UPI000D526387|nr:MULTISPECIES: ABC transporter permease [unclassified Actinobaculum]AWE42133.1 ABC transporter permease [Actinobaculum sp. 313]RTE50694.1 ABC transporter permease [Actinobaculum sp. 352]